jgi:hypothetical protein
MPRVFNAAAMPRSVLTPLACSASMVEARFGSDGSVAVDPTARLASIPKVRTWASGPNGDDVEVIFGRASRRTDHFAVCCI